MAWKDLPFVNVISETDLNEVTINGETVSPQYAAGTASSSGDNQVVAAVTGKKIRVISARLYCDDAAVDAVFRSATTPIDGTAYATLNSGYTEVCKYGLFETNAGEALNLNLSAAEEISYRITYFEVTP